MLTGRKLLLADDSLAIQKVVDLTFSDEGMQVTTVGDGDRALEKLDEIAPDIVLADCFMPGINGYELCRMIRANERFKDIPVILLAGSFEPFNEAEARRVGANDVVTKPFQSIRQLVSKVGSLLGKENASDKPAHEYSTLGLGGPGRAGEDEPAPVDDVPMIDPNVRVMVEAEAPEPASMQDQNVSVFVEAAPMPGHEVAEPEGPSCDTDIAEQTADTIQLERISDEDLSPKSPDSPNAEPQYAQDDTIEMYPVRQVASSSSYSETVTAEPAPEETTGAAGAESSMYSQISQIQTAVLPETAAVAPEETAAHETTPVAPSQSADVFSDALLDLGDVSETSARSSEAMVLDLDFEEAAAAPPLVPVAEVKVEPVASLAESQTATKALTSEPLAEVAAAVARAHDWSIGPATQAVTPVERVAPLKDEAEPEAPAATVNPAELSPETIDAIARRAVEHLSERVVREIAWEVVPELAELLIKQRLDEEK